MFFCGLLSFEACKEGIDVYNESLGEKFMFQFVLQNKESILFVMSAAGSLFFALWFVFFVLYLKRSVFGDGQQL